MIEQIKKIILKEKEPYIYDWVNNINVGKTNYTMRVDNKNRLYVNPKFIQKLTDKQLIGCLYHEVLHIIYGHTQSKKTNHYLINVAGDIFINEQLLSLNYELPDGKLTKETYSIPNNINTAEEIYIWLEINLAQNEKNKLKEINDQENQELEDDNEELETDNIKEIIKQIKEDIEEKQIKNNKIKDDEPIQWDIDLISNIGRLIRREEQNNYIRPARYEPEGIIRPATHINIRTPKINIYIDKSGSMCNMLSVVVNSLIEIKSKLKNYIPTYYAFNTKITQIDETNLINLRADGGTEFKNVIGDADLHIIITDGELDFSFIDSRRDVMTYFIKNNKIYKKSKHGIQN